VTAARECIEVLMFNGLDNALFEVDEALFATLQDLSVSLRIATQPHT
jgi:hypothetical protein